MDLFMSSVPLLKQYVDLQWERKAARPTWQLKNQWNYVYVWKKMVHPKQPKPIKVDNKAAVRFNSKTLKEKREKTTYMIFYQLQDQCNQGQCCIYWAPGKLTWLTIIQNIISLHMIKKCRDQYYKHQKQYKTQHTISFKGVLILAYKLATWTTCH